MGFKENINQEMWGNPNDAKYLDFETWQLYAPYKTGWNLSSSRATSSTYNNFKELMYLKDLPPEIDETICPWGINAKSGIGNVKLMSGYGTTPVIVPVGENTPKGQKPVYITFNNPNAIYSNINVMAFTDTFGYMESKKDEFTTSYPSDTWGYSFVANINLKNMFVAPLLLATDNISQIYTTNYLFTVHDYFTRLSSDGLPFTEVYPYILGVYAGLYYRTQAPSVIPNVYPAVQSKATKEVLDYYTSINTGNTNYMTIPDYNEYRGTGNSAVNPRNVPSRICVIGHNNNQRNAWLQSSSSYPNAKKITTYEDAVKQALDPTLRSDSGFARLYYSYIMPQELDNKLHTGLATHLSNENVGVAWYEGLTEEEIYRQIAYLGFPFYTGNMTYTQMTEYITNNDFTQDDFRHTLMYPDFSANMVTTGTYSPYASSESPLRDTEWLYEIEENYDPEITFPWAVSFTAVGENDDGSQSNLENAVFKLQYNSNSRFNGVESSSEVIINLSEKSVTWTSTTTDTVILGLPQGDYTLTETVTPDGYVQAQNITFSVAADGKVINAVNTFGEVTDNNIRIYNKKARLKTVFQYEYITIYDSKTKQNQFNTHGLGVLTPSSCTITENYNGKWELSITHPFDSDNKYQYIREHNIIKALGQLFTIKVVTYSSGDRNEVSAKAEHIFYQQNDWWISPNSARIIFMPNYSVQSLLDYIDAISEKLIVEGQTYYNYSRYSDMVIPSDYPLRVLSNSDGISPVGAIMDSGGVLEVTKGELYRDNFYFSVKERMENSNDNAFDIRIGTNLKGIKRTVDFTTVCTFFAGFDDYGAVLAVSWDDASVNLVGMPHSVKRSKKFSYTFDDQSMTDEEKINKSFEFLCADVMDFFGTNCKPLISYEVDIEDVQNNPDFAEFNNKPDYRVGNIGTVYDERLGERVRLKITKTIKDAITGKTTSVIFGDNRSFSGNNGYNSAVMDMTPTVEQRSFQLLDSSGALVFDADYNAIIQEV